MENFILDKILILPAILIGLTVHEFSHALVADRLGDKTPKFQGRLTLNPFVHIDLIGFLMIMLVGFGWAKPVQVNPSAFRNFHKDDLKVSLAGPLSNLLVAFIGALIIGLFAKLGLLGITGMGGLSTNLAYMLTSIISINCMLFVFNLMPLPGLDGFHVMRDLFPEVFYKIEEKLYSYQLIILLIFVATPLSTYLVRVPTNFLYYTFIKFVSLMF
ncbi:MAG: site-2 protease family protein [Clostridiaceae bacterium]